MGRFEKLGQKPGLCPACWAKLSPGDSVCGECGEILDGAGGSTSNDMDGTISEWMDYLGSSKDGEESADTDMDFLKQDDEIRELLEDIQTEQKVEKTVFEGSAGRENIAFDPETKQTGEEWTRLEKRFENLAGDLENGIQAGIDTMYLERLYDRAKKEYEDGLLDECRKTLRVCHEELRNRLLRHRMLMDILHTVQEKIAEASKHGFKVDKAIQLLRRAKEEKANGDVENAMHFAMKSSEELDELLQDTSWKVEIDDFLH